MYKITKTHISMDTLISITVVSQKDETEILLKMKKAFECFKTLEKICSRFDQDSELAKLSNKINIPIKTSDILFKTIHFGLEIANITDGLFEITLGKTLEEYGFNKEYITGEKIETNHIPNVEVSYKDILLNEEKREIILTKPMILDLGAIAKGFAVDLAAKQLGEFEGFMINAGGDIFVGGLNENKELWTIGVQHPLKKGEVIYTFKGTNMAVCTSGSYERRSSKKMNTHHLINPKTRESENELISCSVIAPFAMMADSLSTASFIMGYEKGPSVLRTNGVDGIFINSALDIKTVGSLKI